VGVGVADDGDALDVAELVELVLQLLLRRLSNKSIEALGRDSGDSGANRSIEALE
jgi:hypothetical protein